MEDERVTLSGRVSDLDEPVFRVRVKAGGKSRDLHGSPDFSLEQLSLEQLSLEQEEAGTVRVRMSGASALLPVRTVRGDFGQLLDHPLADFALDHAPGDHVATELSGNVLRAGDLVTVLGRVLETRPDGGGNYRESGGTIASVIAADAIAIGDGGAELLDEWEEEQQEANARRAARSAKKRTDKGQQATATKGDEQVLALTPAWVFGGLAVAAGLMFISYWSVSVQVAAFAWAVMIGALSSSVFVWRSRRWFPQFREVGRFERGTGYRWGILGWVVIGCVLALVLSIAASAAPFVGVIASAAVPLMYLMVTLYRDQRSAWTARHLLRAESMASELPDKQFGSIEGGFAGQLTVTRKHSPKSESHSVTRTDSQGASFQTTQTRTTIHWTEKWSMGRGTIRIGETEVGLEPKGALFAAPPQVSYPSKATAGVETFLKHMPDGKMRDKIRKADTSGRASLRSGAASGDSLLVLGRARRENGEVELRATGPGSLVVFASPPGTSARVTLRRLTRLHYAGVLAFVALIGSLVAMAFLWLSSTGQ